MLSGDGYRSDAQARQESEDRVGCFVQMQGDPVAGGDAAGGQPGREPTALFCQLRAGSGQEWAD